MSGTYQWLLMDMNYSPSFLSTWYLVQGCGSGLINRYNVIQYKIASRYKALLTFINPQVQIHLYSQLATEFSMKPLGNTGLNLQELVGVPQLIFILQEYYSLTASEGHPEVRPYLLLIVKEFVTKVLSGLYQLQFYNILQGNPCLTYMYTVCRLDAEVTCFCRTKESRKKSCRAFWATCVQCQRYSLPTAGACILPTF